MFRLTLCSTLCASVYEHFSAVGICIACISMCLNVLMKPFLNLTIGRWHSSTGQFVTQHDHAPNPVPTQAVVFPDEPWFASFHLNCYSSTSGGITIQVETGKCYSSTCGSNYRLRNDLYCVEWGVKLYSIQSVAVISVHTSPGFVTCREFEGFNSAAVGFLNRQTQPADHAAL